MNQQIHDAISALNVWIRITEGRIMDNKEHDYMVYLDVITARNDLEKAIEREKVAKPNTFTLGGLMAALEGL